MADDRDEALRKLRDSTGAYAELYPTLHRRMADIAASDDPKVRRFTDDMVEAFRGREQAQHAWIASQFGLTPKETQVALHLAAGGSVSEYAEQHNLSEQTVRTQLKAIFAKTGVNRQSALAVLILGRPPTL